MPPELLQLSKACIRARTKVSGSPTTENAPLEMAILQRVSALGASEGIVRLLAVLEDGAFGDRSCQLVFEL